MAHTLFIGFDFWGAGNLGDDLMMAGFTEWVSVHAPGTRLSALCAHDIEAMRLRFPSINWVRPGTPEAAAALDQATAWIGLGGSPFQSDLGPWLLEQMSANMRLAGAKGLPCYLVGVGLNNREALATEAARVAVNTARHTWLRDAYCLEQARAAGLPESKVSLGADLAHLACASRKPQAESQLGSMILHAPASKLCGHALAVAARQTRLKWHWTCQEQRPLADSETLLHAAFDADTRALLAYQNFNYAGGSLNEAFQHLSRAELVLSSRYHGSLAAAWAGARLAIHDRNDKLLGLRLELDAEPCPALDDAEALVRAFQQARRVDIVRLQECAQRAHTMLRALFDALA